MKAMIFAAGLGTRLKPLTDTLPKALVPIAGKPMLEHVILKLKKYGFDDIVINIHHFADKIIEFVISKNNFNININFSDERDCLLETGGGIKHAARFLNDNQPFLVHNVDIISDVNLSEMYKTHCKNKPFATLLVSSRKTARYLMFNKHNNLCGWINKQTNQVKWSNNAFKISDCNEFAFGGIHVISPEIFDNFGNWEGKFSIVDYYLWQAQKYNIRAYFNKNLQIIDIGKIENLAQVEKQFTNLL